MSDMPRSRGANPAPEKMGTSPGAEAAAEWISGTVSGAAGGPAMRSADAAASAALDRAALQEGLYDLFCFLLTAARQLPREPVRYGPLRLTDAATRLAGLAEAHGVAAPGIADAVAAIAPGRRQALDNPAALMESLDAAIVRLAAGELDRLAKGASVQLSAGQAGEPAAGNGPQSAAGEGGQPAAEVRGQRDNGEAQV